MRKLSITMVVLLLALTAVSASAASGKMKAKPEAFNPTGTCPIVAAWKTKIGLPDAGKSNHGLLLEKNCPTSTEASADATVTPVEGVVLTSLSFDHKLGTYCSSGAPRWNVEMTDGSVYGLLCSDGTKSGAPAGWEHVSWTCANPSAAVPLSGPPGCAFGKTLVFAQVLQDEQGSTTLDNLELNGCVMGKPGNC